MSLETGARLGPYEIESAIGAGGMGEVYRARDTRLDRTVAIKVLLPHLSSNESLRQRFEREAKSISQLTHPNICGLYDVGHENETSYLVMEFLEGRSLADRLAEGPLRTDEVLKYGAQIAEALAAAHRSGVIHRDLKPGNVMLTPSGAKLLDFGLAKALPKEAEEASALTSSLTMAAPLTSAGTLVGTFQYMAPEQLEGGEADARSDVFAFGATLHEMTTGQKAFDGKSQASVIASVLEREPPPVSSIQAMAPPALGQLIAQCLRKDPQDRRQSMHDIALELRWMQDAGSQAGVPLPIRTRRKSRERTGWIAAAVTTAAALVLASLLVLDRLGSGGGASDGSAPLRAQLTLPPGHELELRSNHPGPPALSPDGRHLAYVTRETLADEPPRLRIQDLSSGRTRTPDGVQGAGYPFWSPDGRKIGYFASGGLFVLDLDAEKTTRLCDALHGKGGSWGDDDLILFSPTANGPIAAIESVGGEPRALTVVDTTVHRSHRYPFRIPKSDRFLFAARPRQVEDLDTEVLETYLGSIDGTEPVLLTLDTTSQVTWVDDWILFVRDRTLYARRFDPGKEELSSPELALADDIATIEGAAYGLFTGTSGRIVHATGMESVDERILVWFDRRGRSLGELGEPGLYDRPRISPDGRSVALEIEDPREGTRDIWVMDAERGLPTRFTSDPHSDTHAVWSPDSRRIAFVSDRDGTATVYAQSIDGGEAERIAKLPDQTYPYSWSPDGKHLTATAGLDNWILSIDQSREPYRFASTENFSEWAATFSPNGRWIAYVSNESGRLELYMNTFPTPGRKIRVSPHGTSGLRWSRGGRELNYVTEKSEIYAVPLGAQGDDISVGTPQLLFREPAAREGDIAPDGESLLLLLAPDATEHPPLQLIEGWQAGLEKP